MKITVAKIGTGDYSDPYRPDTDATDYNVIEERETEFVIEVFNKQV